MAQVVFVVPHADDDALSMGCAIRNHLEARAADGTAAHQVHTLLLTPGSGSAAQPGTGLSDGEFSAARDDEYLRACRSLGVPFHRIHFAEDRQVGDTVLTVEEAQDAISALLGELDPANGPVWGKALSNLGSTSSRTPGRRSRPRTPGCRSGPRRRRRSTSCRLRCTSTKIRTRWAGSTASATDRCRRTLTLSWPTR